MQSLVQMQKNNFNTSYVVIKRTKLFSLNYAWLYFNTSYVVIKHAILSLGGIAYVISIHLMLLLNISEWW